MAKKKETKTVTCCVTGEQKEVNLTSAGNPRTPRQWKHVGDKFYSAKAWKSAWRYVTITLPVASPATEGGGSKEEWQQLRAPATPVICTRCCGIGPMLPPNRITKKARCSRTGHTLL